MPEGQNYSRIDAGRKELIDHVLVSAALVKPLTAITVAAIVPEPLASIATNPTLRRNQPSSDHAPIVASLRVFDRGIDARKRIVTAWSKSCLLHVERNWDTCQ
jgi:hypothetical protein